VFLSRRTVQTYISHILAKLGAKGRVGIVREALLQVVSPWRRPVCRSCDAGLEDVIVDEQHLLDDPSIGFSQLGNDDANYQSDVSNLETACGFSS
jgi:hypothetical protein